MNDGRWRRAGRAGAAAALAVACLAGRAGGDSPAAATRPVVATQPARTGVEFLSRLNADVTLRAFANHPDAFAEDRYVTELDVALQGALVSVADSWRLVWNLDLRTGMGRSVDTRMPFSPFELAYALGPVLEHERGGWLWRAGWDHACWHLVLKDPEDDPWYNRAPAALDDVYVNRLFVGGGNGSSRGADVRRALVAGRGRGWRGRVLWRAEAGYYLRSLSGVLDEDVLYENNDWAWDVSGEGRAALWVGRGTALLLRYTATLLANTDARTFWRDEAALEWTSLREGGGAALFLGWHPVDRHPRDSKEGLTEAGFRVWF
jgi:hypothetical protein